MDATIRLATITDTPAVVDMGRKFLLSGPYKDRLGDSPANFFEFTLALISSPLARVLVAEDKSGHPIGVLAFAITPHYLSKELTANELIWYVEPEYRGQLSLELFWAAKKMAKELGAIWLQFTAPDEKAGAIYKRLGLEQLEVGYQMRLV